MIIRVMPPCIQLTNCPLQMAASRSVTEALCAYFTLKPPITASTSVGSPANDWVTIHFDSFGMLTSFRLNCTQFWPPTLPWLRAERLLSCHRRAALPASAHRCDKGQQRRNRGWLQITKGAIVHVKYRRIIQVSSTVRRHRRWRAVPARSR